MPTLWAGIDAGKRTHHCVVIDGAGAVLLSLKVSNDENKLLDLIATVIELSDGGGVCWATDLTDGARRCLSLCSPLMARSCFISRAESCITPQRRIAAELERARKGRSPRSSVPKGRLGGETP